MIALIYDLCYGLLVGLGWPYLLYRRLTRGSSGCSLGEYLGRVPSRPVAGRCVWIHGVSLGEINATRTLVAEFRRRSPDCVVVLSSTTKTGLERARKLYPKLIVFRFPFDFSFAMRTLLTRIRPSAIVLMELEAWPNLIEVASARQIPVVIANGRVTEQRSIRRFNRPVIRWIARRMFRRLRWVGVQDQTYASRFVELGVPPERVSVTGSLKYDAADLVDHVEGQDQLAQDMGIDTAQPLWVCGSTGPGEEAMILDAYATARESFPDLQLAIIPRKPERFDEVADLIVSRGYACLRRSTGAPVLPPHVDEPRPVALGDTMGELRMFYGLADVVFVGRSLVPLGGSDVMEVAGLAKPLIVGPHTDNFTEAVQLLLSEGGCRQISSPDTLPSAVIDLLRHPARRQKTGQAARAAIAGRRGATSKTVEQILGLIG